jgi:FRG domain-containing protein
MQDDSVRRVVTRKLKSWRDIGRYARPGWIYRGQADAKWSLRTSFERCCDRHRIKPGFRIGVEQELFREFRRAYHEHATHVPGEEAVVEWLSLMQHYGGPTRLLDFTYSIYVAAYFATETTTTDAAVWAVNGKWAMQRSVASLRASGKRSSDIERLQIRFVEDTEKLVKNLFFKAPQAPLACPLNPFRLNERLRIQKGVFLAPGSVRTPFMENILSMRGWDSSRNMCRIIIPATLAEEVRAALFEMNITRRSLFPGLDGYAFALGVYHPIFNPRDPMSRWVARSRLEQLSD